MKKIEISWLKVQILLLVLVLLFNTSLLGQNEHTKRLDKYRFYRARLSSYFVKPGDKVGESIVAYAVNKHRSDIKGFSIGDQTIDLAWYISILSTEYALLKKSNQNTNQTLTELYYALKAYERLDRCETQMPWFKSQDTLDGFFHRYDISLFTNPDTFSILGRNKNLNPRQVFGSREPGLPTWISSFDNESGIHNPYEASASQDQVVHLLMGLSLTYQCLPDSELVVYDNKLLTHKINFKNWSKNLVDVIISHLLQGPHWHLLDPNDKDVERGANALMYAYPLSLIGRQITGKDYDDWWSKSLIAKHLWDLSRVPNWVNDYNSTMALILAALSDSWYDLSPVGPINNTASYIEACGQPWDRQTIFLLLHRFTHQKTKNYACEPILFEQLDSAPNNGPYYWSQDSIMFDCCGVEAGKPKGGWAYPNKFRGTKKEQNGLGKYPSTGNFSGVDYMLLYNLYHLNYQPIPYNIDD